MQVLTTPSELTPAAGCVFVPTMGALHAGHTALIEHAARVAGGLPVCVSIFVNPTQFAPGEDFETYPRSLDADVAAIEAAGGRFVFVPSAQVIYPEGQPHRFDPLPRVACEPQLEDRHRPQFFHGVCSVVRRLFELVQPSVAVFGEKDYQQLLVIREMVETLGLGITIDGQPTVRETDGLALSSRNAYLRPEDREQALGLSRALRRAQPKGDPARVEESMRQVLREHDLDIDYAVVRDAATLLPMQAFDRPARGLIAVRLRDLRLIDNRPLD
jgi:pantoate--beta-alanine ligase